MSETKKWTLALLLGAIVLVVLGTAASNVSGQLEHDSQQLALKCTSGFEYVEGQVNLSATNIVGGTLIVAAYAENLSHTGGYIQFFRTTNTSLWMSQEPGAQSYSLTATGGVAGYLSCTSGGSAYPIHAGAGQMQYVFNDTLGQPVMVLIVICGANPPTTPPVVDAQEAAANYTYRQGPYFLGFYGGIFGVEGNNTVVVDTSNPNSYVFVFSVSTNIYGRVVGKISPAYVKVTVNDTPIALDDGVINISLPFGVYQFNISAPGYINMSIIEVIYGGRTTHLDVSLASLMQTRIRLLERVLSRLLEVAIAVSAIYLGWVSYKLKTGVTGITRQAHRSGPATQRI
jgi:hypothetical protein